MRHHNTILADLLTPISRRRFDSCTRCLGGDRYAKSMRTWGQFVAMIFAQLSEASSLRGLESSWNANAHHHYHLGANPVRRSTLADANKRRAAHKSVHRTAVRLADDSMTQLNDAISGSIAAVILL